MVFSHRYISGPFGLFRSIRTIFFKGEIPMYDVLGYLTLALIPAFILLDLVHRHRRFETPRFWRLRALVVTVGIFFFTGWVAGLWGAGVRGHQPA
jgi:hypothetical protein